LGRGEGVGRDDKGGRVLMTGGGGKLGNEEHRAERRVWGSS